MATHSSTLAWRIPWTEEPGRLQSMGSQRTKDDSATFTHSFLCKISGEKRHFQFFFFLKMLYCCFFYDQSEKDF